MDYAYLLYLQYTGASLSNGNVCRYTVTSNEDDKKICILVLKFYADVAHAQSTKVEYHEHRYTAIAEEVTYCVVITYIHGLMCCVIVLCTSLEQNLSGNIGFSETDLVGHT